MAAGRAHLRNLRLQTLLTRRTRGTSRGDLDLLLASCPPGHPLLARVGCTCPADGLGWRLDCRLHWHTLLTFLGTRKHHGDDCMVCGVPPEEDPEATEEPLEML